MLLITSHLFLIQLEKRFITEGGIKERMTAARLGYRNNQKEEIKRLTNELNNAKKRIAELEKLLKEKDNN